MKAEARQMGLQEIFLEDCWNYFSNIFSSYAKKKVLLYGAGLRAKCIISTFKKNGWMAFPE